MKMNSKKTSVIVPAGIYILGDPCYTVPEDRWMDLLNSNCDYFEASPIGELDQYFVLAFGTAYGDGEYTDNTGWKYPVDSGLIGLVPWELGKHRYEENMVKLTMMDDFECTNNDGVMKFDYIIIDTKNENDEYDEEDE